MTSKEGVFAGGDVTTGPSTVVSVIAAGRQAARSIAEYLTGKPAEEESLYKGFVKRSKGCLDHTEAVRPNILLKEERSADKEDDQGLDFEAVRTEALMIVLIWRLDMRVQDSSTYDRLLAVAARLFALQGFDGTTTRQIVKEAGSSLSSLQIHFKSKESLYRAVMEKTQDSFYALNEPVLNEIDERETQGILDEDSAGDLIVEFTGQIVEWAFMSEYTNEILLINRELLQPSGQFDTLPDAIHRLYHYYKKLFEVYVGEKNTF